MVIDVSGSGDEAAEESGLRLEQEPSRVKKETQDRTLLTMHHAQGPEACPMVIDLIDDGDGAAEESGLSLERDLSQMMVEAAQAEYDAHAEPEENPFEHSINTDNVDH
jgi:hypothetical protein